MSWGYILCINDDLQELNTLANQLQEEFSLSHIVHKAESAEDAVLLMDMFQATRKRLELIICDQTMPGIQGLEFLNTIHQTNPEIMKVLLIDQEEQLHSEYLLARSTINHLIQKPWSKEHLILTVGSLLRLYRISRHIEELQQIGLQIGPIFELPKLLRKTIQYIHEIITASKVAIAITDGKTPEIKLFVTKPDYTFDQETTSQIEQLLQNFFGRRREPLVFNTISGNEPFQPLNIPGWEQISRLVCVPLWRQNNFFGAILVADKELGLPFFRDDVLFINIIAYQLLANLENVYLTEEKLRMDRLSTIGNMAGEIIHDLKGPMTSILGFAELLAEGECTEEEQKEFSEIIGIEVERMVEMVEEILEFSRGSKMKLQLQTCDIKQLIEEVCDALTPKFKEQGIQIVTKLRCTKPIYADKEKLKRVFYNIANNAKEAMKQHGKFSINTYLRNETHVEFRLADSGVGIPPQVKENLFEPFVTHGKKRGTGLGMSIAKKIITDHGGEIWVESEEGRGTIFYFTIPIVQK